MADGLDVVTIGVEYKGTVIAGVVLGTQAGGAIITGAGGEGGVVKGFDGFAIVGLEGDVQGLGGLTFVNPEVRFAVFTEAQLAS